MSAPWQIVAQREIAVKLRDKNFLISIGVMLLILAVSFGFQAFMANKTETTMVAVTQQAGPAGLKADALTRAAETVAKKDGKKVAFSLKNVASAAEAEKAVKDEKADAALIPDGDKGWKLISKKSVDSTLQSYVSDAVAQHTMTANAKARNVDLVKLSSGSAVQATALEDDHGKTGLALVVSFIFAFLFYFATMMFGMPIAQSVIEEKQSRIVEILASAIPLRQLLAGKILGNSIIALGQLIVLVSIALIGVSFTKYKSFVGSVAGASGWFIAFFIVGFLVLASLYGVAGSLASRSEDMQSSMQPIMLLTMATFFCGLMAKGTVLAVASYIPVVSSVAMPKRVMMGEAGWWEPLVALAISLAAAYAIVTFAAKVYTRTVMRSGGALTYRQALALKD